MGDTDPRDARGGRRRFSAAGRLDPPGPSLAATFTIGYTGFITGPPLMVFSPIGSGCQRSSRCS
jgi:hypothetical protein